ncbi:hypothetical protein KCH_15440 [Kitasatospora cheerisanensis KCTC 2395]|uniref:HTH luxR-type domain-containing protein n=1 Tax=Kitasatospora cheerisanensis KCTC 2395 TaxID=1348663 RepID=A0A066Z995_9ACTN|nr:hypothetical protein KCH_15440 [Kitasatospora cheerisanensis KCTC 2395]
MDRQRYLELLHDGNAPAPDDPAIDERLRAAGLIAPNPDAPGTMLALEPGLAAARRRDTLLAQAGAALQEAASLETEYRDLAVAFSIADPDMVDGAVEYLQGMEQINARIADLIANGTQELLTAQPTGPRVAERLAISENRDTDAIRRGMAMRTIYRTTARSDATTGEWVAHKTALGAHIRTLDEPFSRAIVVDRCRAVLPNLRPWTGAGPEPLRAIVVHDEALARHVAEAFDRDWDRSTPWTGAEEPRAGLTDLQVAIGRRLAEGMLQPAIARDLEVSSRTVTHQIAQMKVAAGVTTLFQLAIWWERRSGRAA